MATVNEITPEKKKFYEAVLARCKRGENLKSACAAEGQSYVSGWYAIRRTLNGKPPHKKKQKPKSKVIDIPTLVPTSNGRSMLFVGSREDLLNIAKELS